MVVPVNDDDICVTSKVILSLLPYDMVVNHVMV